MKAECEIVAQAWDGIIPALQAGKYDAIMAGMSITDKRKKVISFSRAYAATPARFVALKSSPHAKFTTSETLMTLDDISAGERTALDAIVKEFKGKTIGVQTSTTHENFLREYLGKDADIKAYDTQENLDLDLQSGRVDVALASMSYWVPLLESDKGSEMLMVGPGMTGGPFGAGVGVGIRQKDADLAAKFSAAINAAIKDGVVEKLAVQWFGFDSSAH
jgi:octopine/nopaline transport system substrate-binding protein